VFEYHNAPEKTAAAHPKEHVYSLGDIGRVDEDGWVFLADRASHMIISGGVNIYPAEVEHALVAHPAVADAGVFGIPNEEWGEEVKAAVELRDGYEPSDELEKDLLAHCRVHLAGYKVPRSIDFLDELPRQPTGKLFKQKLKAPYWEAAGRTI
jgi:long-chain acyl-CoA synthetase